MLRELNIYGGLWLIWVGSWAIASVWSSRVGSRPGFKAELPYRVVQVIGVVLIFFDFGHMQELTRLWRTSMPANVVLIGVIIAGFAVTWWARLTLGRLWSGDVTRKVDHHIVTAGPYALVRHPIYTGLFMALGATALARGSAAALVGAVVVIIGIVIKAQLEERFLAEQLGGGAYEDYRRRVPMLVPFLRPRG